MSIKSKRVFFFIVFMVFTFHAVLGANPDKIVFGYHEAYPPYSYEENNGDAVGIFPEVIKEAANIIGIKVEFEKYPWKRMIQCAKNGKVDAIMPLFKTEERKKYLFYPTNSIAIVESYFFTLKGRGIKYSGNLQSLRHLKIGVIGGYSYGKEFDNAKYLTKDISSCEEKMVEKLTKGRIDVGFASDLIVKFHAKKLNVLDKIEFLEPPFIRENLYAAFSKETKERDHKELTQRFSKSIEQLKKRGKYQDILKKYGFKNDIALGVGTQKIIIGFDQEDYFPYSYKKDGNYAGVCTEIIKIVTSNLKLEFEYKEDKWDTLLDYAEKGKIDAIMPLFKTKEREQYLLYPYNGLVVEENFLFAKKNNNIQFSGNLEDLRHYMIGTVTNYSYGSKFDEATYLNKKKFQGVGTLVKNLKEDKIKIAVGAKRVINSYAKKLGIEHEIELLKPSLGKCLLYLAFSKKKGYKELGKKFSNEIEKLRRDDTYNEILKDNGIENITVKLAADNWPPYYGKDLKKNGPISEIISEAFKRVGYNVSIEFVPWANLLDKVKKGKYDAGFTATKTEERSKYYDFSEYIATRSPIVFLKKKETKISYTQLKDLKSYRIGVVQGYVYDSEFDRANLNKIEAHSPTANIKNLLLGRLDLAITDKLVAQHLIKIIKKNKEFGKKLDELEFMDIYPDRETRKNMYLMISKEYETFGQIKRDFNYGLKQISDDGTLAKILKDHGVANEIFRK